MLLLLRSAGFSLLPASFSSLPCACAGQRQPQDHRIFPVNCIRSTFCELFFFFSLSIFPSQSFFQPLLTLTSKRTRPDQSGPSRLQLLSFTPFPHPLFLSPSSLRIVRPSSSSDRPASSPLSSPFFDFVLGFFSIVFSVYCAVFTFSPSAYNIPSPEAYPRYDPSVLNQTTQQFEQLQTKGTGKSHISLLFTITCFWRPYFRFAAPFALPHILPSSVLERACTASLIHPALA